MLLATKQCLRFLIFAQGLSYGLSNSKKRGKIITNFEKSVFSGQQEVEEHLAIIDCTNNVPAPSLFSNSSKADSRNGWLFVQSIIARCSVQSIIARCSSTSCWPEKTHFSIVLEALHHGQHESGRNRSICWPERTAEWTFCWLSECKWQKGCSTLHPGQDKNRIANLPTGLSSSRVADRIVVSSWTRNQWLATGLPSSTHTLLAHTIALCT